MNNNLNQIKVDDLVLLTIKRMGINGEGIGYYKRLAVFIPGAIVGEVVEVKITKVFDKYAYGEIAKIKEASPSRVEARCPHYDKCGGCNLQHMTYAEQLNQKKLLVIEAFDRYFDGDYSKIKFYDTIGMDDPWHYRNKTQLPTRHDGDKVVVGMYEADSNRLVYIDECPLESRLINTTMKKILDYLTKSSINVYNPKFRQGNLRYIVLRAFEETKEVQATFVLMQEEKRLLGILEKVIKIDNVKSVNYTINDDPKAIEIISGPVKNISGEKMINGMLKDLKFSISPDSFFQLNTTQTVVLYDEILSAINPVGSEKVVDCYCGIGSIGLYLASRVKEVRGIDNNKAAITNARHFAEENNIGNAKFYSGNILPFLEEFKNEGFIPDVLIVDPPRRGLELSLLNYLQKSRIKKIVYVSCNPSTLAKNLNHLQKNYKISFVKPLDMFPNTSNVEAVVLLSNKSKN